MVMSAGRSRVNLVVPARTETACRPLVGDTGLAAPPLIAMVPLLTQLGIRTKYVNGFSALIVVASESLNGYKVSTVTETLFAVKHKPKCVSSLPLKLSRLAGAGAVARAWRRGGPTICECGVDAVRSEIDMDK